MIIKVVMVTSLLLVMAAILLAGRIGYKAGYQQAKDDILYEQDVLRREMK